MYWRDIVSGVQKHSGTWNLYEKQYQGELYVNTDERIIVLEILIAASEKNPLPRFDYKGKIKYICGTLTSGAKILLYDCTTGKEHGQFMQYTQQVIYSKYAFWGLAVDSNEEIRFQTVMFDLGNIIAWSGLCNYKWECADGGYNLIWVHKKPVTFELSDGLKITLVPSQDKIGYKIYER